MSENLFLSSVMLICAVMAVVNLLLVKRRGPSAVLMSLAFLAFGATLYFYQQGASQTLVSLGGLAVVLLLAGDFYLRFQRRP